MQRILLMVLLTSLTTAPARAEFNIIEAGIADMAQAMASGKLTSRELVQQYLIRIATYDSAVFLGKADQLGSIDPGKLADLVLLSKDPAADINNAKAIVFVVKGGQIIDETQLPLAGGKQPRRFSLP